LLNKEILPLHIAEAELIPHRGGSSSAVCITIGASMGTTMTPTVCPEKHPVVCVTEEDDTERELSCLLLLQCLQYNASLATQQSSNLGKMDDLASPSSVSIRFLPSVFPSPELRCHAAWNFFRF